MSTRTRRKGQQWFDGSQPPHLFLECVRLKGVHVPCDACAAAAKVREETPEPRVLFCPMCRVQHVDQGEWANRVHRTHECAHCKTQWRPARNPTVGVPIPPRFFSPITGAVIRDLIDERQGLPVSPFIIHGSFPETTWPPSSYQRAMEALARQDQWTPEERERMGNFASQLKMFGGPGLRRK